MSLLDDRLRAGLTSLVDDVMPSRTPEEVLADLRARPALVVDTPAPARPQRRRALVAVAAFVVVVLGVAVLVLFRDGADQPTHVDVPPTTGPTGTGDPRGLGAGWHDLPSSPLGKFSGALVWTGEQVISWRGEGFGSGGFGTGDGWTTASAAFDMASGEWSVLPADPLGDAVVTEGDGVWTGDQAIFWSKADLVIWSPSAGTWRTGTKPPRPIRDGKWTGSALVFWNDGLSYDPISDAWSSIPLPPEGVDVARLSAVSVWTGTEIIVATGTEGVAYSPDTGVWTELPSIPSDQLVQGQVNWDTYMAGAVQVGEEVWVIEGTGGPTAPGFAFSLIDRTWRRLTIEERPPLPGSEGPPVLAAIDGVLYAADAGGQESVRVGDGPWSVASGGGRTEVVNGGSMLFASFPSFAVYVPPEAVADDIDIGTFAVGTWGLVGELPGTLAYPRIVAADDEVYLWDGARQGESATAGDGYAFDPDTGSWRGIPALPTEEPQVQLGLWTDRRVVGWAEGGVWSWAPGDEAWELDPFPGEGPMQTVYQRQPVWTGEDLFFWADGWAYRPRDREWSRIAPMPSVPTRAWSAWTGNAGYVVGLASDALPGMTVAHLYDPQTDRWTQTETPGVDGSWLGLATMGSYEVVAVDPSGTAVLTMAAAATWDPLPAVPFARPSPEWLLVSHLPRSVLVTTEGGGGWLLTDGAWAAVPGTPDEVRATEPWRDGLLGVSVDGRLWWYRSVP